MEMISTNKTGKTGPVTELSPGFTFDSNSYQHSYEELMAKIREDEHNRELCGSRSFEDIMEETLQKGECISVEQLFHLLVNDVHKIYHEDEVPV